MGYLYYPGCSLEGTAREYDLSCRELFRAMGVCLTDIPDWTCCGATAAQYVDQFLSVVLPARNLALAEKTETGLDVLVPCSACYLNLKKPGKRSQGIMPCRIRSTKFWQRKAWPFMHPCGSGTCWMC